MRQSQIYIELFRVPTVEILEEVKNRLLTGNRSQYKNYTNKELLQFVLYERQL